MKLWSKSLPDTHGNKVYNHITVRNELWFKHTDASPENFKFNDNIQNDASLV